MEFLTRIIFKKYRQFIAMKTLLKIREILCSGILWGALLSPSIAAPVTTFKDSFETDGAGTRYLVENGNDDGEANFFSRRQEFSNGTVASGGAIDGSWVWGARDIDDANNKASSVEGLLAQEGRLTWEGIDISDLGSIQLIMAVAEGGEGFEPNNTLLVEIRVDGGDWINIGGFRSIATNDPARYFVGGENTLTSVEDPRLVPEFADFAWNIKFAGSQLDLRITFNSNADAEDYYIDNVRIVGDDAVGFIATSLPEERFEEPSEGDFETTLSLSIDSPAPAGGLNISLERSSLALSTLDLPESLVVPAGESTLSVPVKIRQDNRYTGTKIIEVDFIADGYSDERLRFRVENVTPQPRLVMMEIMNVVPGVVEFDLVGDSNGDGIRNGNQDQFVEIVNFEDFVVDISGWTISDDLGVRHEFPDGSTIGPGRALVVFSGGNPTGVFGGAKVQKASSGLLAFNSSRSEVATLVATLGGLIETVDLLINGDIQPVDPRGGSIHRTTGEVGAGYTIHSQIPTSGSRVFSPGTLPDGSPYFVPDNELTLTLNQASVAEDAGAAAVLASVTLSSPAPTGGLEVQIESNGFIVEEGGSITPDEISLETNSVVIPEGQTQVTFAIGAFNDGLLDGDREIAIVVRAGDDILPALALLTIRDVEPNPFNVIINEAMPMVLGTGSDINLNGVSEETVGDKFVEMVNLSGFIVDFSGWQLRVTETGGFSAPEIVHTFPEGTRINDQGAIVVFGKITEETLAARDTVFGGAVIQGASNPDETARSNGLSLQRNQDTTIELLNAEGFRVAEMSYESDMGYQAMSITRVPQFTGVESLHLEATQGEFIIYSPGLSFDGTPFPVAGEAPALPEEPVVASSVSDAQVSIESSVVNMSILGNVDGDPLIMGFVIDGKAANDVIIRAAGPSLSSVNSDFTGELPDPSIELYMMDTAGTAKLVESNDDWSSSSKASELRDASKRVGAFQFEDDGKDAAIFATLTPGVYTAVIPTKEAAGNVLAEIYLVNDSDVDSQLVNVSSRLNIPENRSAISGFVIDGDAAQTVLVRAVGSGMGAGALEDPQFVLVQDGAVLASNDDWSTAENFADVSRLAGELGAFELNEGSNDAAFLAHLEPGVYSVIVSGANGSGGVVLLEVYSKK